MTSRGLGGRGRGRRGCLTRAGPGRGVFEHPPSGFSPIAEKRRRGAPPFLAQLFIHLFRTLNENFRPRSLKVRSPGHVKWPHLRKTLNVRHSYTEWLITLKLSAIDIRTSIYETYISEFRYRWPKVRSILRPLHYKSKEKNERRLFCTKTIQNTLKHRVTGIIDFLSRNIVTSDPSACHQGHGRSWKVTSSFSGVTLDIDQLERWKRHRCVQTDNTDRLICNMTFSDQVMTLTWGQIFNRTFQG